MKVVAYDPFLTEKRALELGVEKVELDDAARPRRLHHPAHAAHRCDPQHPVARGARADASAACASSTARAAAWWTRRRWPRRSIRPCRAARRSTCSRPSRRRSSPLFALENVVCTPHLGAATAEAQENVALAGRRADERLPADRRGDRTRSTCRRSRPRMRRACKPYMELCRAARRIRGPAHAGAGGRDPARHRSNTRARCAHSTTAR